MTEARRRGLYPALTITPDGIRRPVAASILALLLALSHRLLVKDRTARSGRWEEKLDHMGTGLDRRARPRERP